MRFLKVVYGCHRKELDTGVKPWWSAVAWLPALAPPSHRLLATLSYWTLHSK